jgi:hypothetical protein
MPDLSATPDAPTLTRRKALRTGLFAAAGVAGLAGCGAGNAKAVAAAVSPSSGPTGTQHTATRLTISPGLAYDEMVSRFEKTVPPLPAAELAAAVKSKP